MICSFDTWQKLSAPPIRIPSAKALLCSIDSHVALKNKSWTGPGIGRPSPVLVVLEEAHRYLGEGANAVTRASANRIAREGRKYGVGSMLVTQRPTELPKTALAQCGTIIALRLSNSDDQSSIRAALPDTVAGLAAVLSSWITRRGWWSGSRSSSGGRLRSRSTPSWTWRFADPAGKFQSCETSILSNIYKPWMTGTCNKRAVS